MNANNLKQYFYPLGDATLIVLVSIFLALSENIAFFRQLLDVYPWAENAGFILSSAILLTSVLVFATALICLALPTRFTLTFLLLLATFAGYYSDKFGTIMDVEMVRNTFQTNMAEANDLLSLSLLFRVLVLGVIPIYWVWRLPYQQRRWLNRKTKIAATGAVGFAFMLISILPYSDQYFSFFREHKQVRYYTNPAYPLWSIGKYIEQSLALPESRSLQSLNAEPAFIEHNDAHELIILVVGETARADHFSLNGYARDTNPLLAKESNLLSYQDVSACGTSTAVSVPCMFAHADQNNFDLKQADNTENTLDLLHQVGVNVLWRDNNSSSKGVADRITYQDFRSPTVNPECDSECRDIGMLEGLQEYIDQQPGDVLIVLHQMGSHGPAYYKRYPKEFEHFTPACQSAELSQCSQETIINAYDNSIRYTDYFLSKVIALLKRNTPQYETAMFYVSDHGESLGELGLYLHGMPYRFAPEAQTKVPIIAWTGSSSDIDYQQSLAQTDKSLSHDAVFDTLLQVFEVKSNLQPASKTPLVLLQQEYDAN